MEIALVTSWKSCFYFFWNPYILGIIIIHSGNPVPNKAVDEIMLRVLNNAHLDLLIHHWLHLQDCCVWKGKGNLVQVIFWERLQPKPRSGVISKQDTLKSSGLNLMFPSWRFWVMVNSRCCLSIMYYIYILLLEFHLFYNSQHCSMANHQSNDKFTSMVRTLVILGPVTISGKSLGNWGMVHVIG